MDKATRMQATIRDNEHRKFSGSIHDARQTSKHDSEGSQKGLHMQNQDLLIKKREELIRKMKDLKNKAELDPSKYESEYYRVKELVRKLNIQINKIEFDL